MCASTQPALNSGNSPSRSPTKCMSSIFVILKFKRAYLKFSVSGRSKQTYIHTHVRNEVTLVWGSPRLAPITSLSLHSNSFKVHFAKLSGPIHSMKVQYCYVTVSCSCPCYLRLGCLAHTQRTLSATLCWLTGASYNYLCSQTPPYQNHEGGKKLVS